jgi:hypothetical protein
MSSRLTAGVAALALIAFMPLRAFAQDAAACDGGGAFKSRTYAVLESLDSTSYKNVPSTGVNFTQGAKGCVLVLFSSVMGTDGLIRIRAVIDGGAFVGTPAEIEYTRDAARQARGFTFLFTGIPAGRHTVAIQYRREGGGVGQVVGRSTTVFYTP